MWSGMARPISPTPRIPPSRYLYPKEGFSLWLDSFCLPKGAKNITEAHLFLDYILRPEIAARISSEMGYSSPNAMVGKYLQEEIHTNPIVYPGEAITARGEFLTNLDDATSQLYEAVLDETEGEVRTESGTRFFAGGRNDLL